MEEEVNGTNANKIGLKREVGLISAVNFMLSCVIGTGTFITPGSILAVSGSVGMSLVIWALCGFISLLTCLPFGELSTVVPKSGSVYIYLYAAFNDMHPFIGGFPAFTYFWIMYFIVVPCQIALAAILFAEYFFIIVQGFKDDCQNTLMQHAVGAAVLVLIGAINCYSVKIHVKSQNVLSYIKMASICFLIGCGFFLFVTGKALQFNPGFEGTDYSIKAFTQAIYFGLFTYDGGVFITTITEEIKHPEKNILRSIILGLAITTMTFVFLNVTFFMALTPKEVATGSAVIVQFATNLFGVSGGTISALIICLTLLTNIMSILFYITRLGFVAAREGHMMKFLCCIHKSRHTPAPAVVCQITLSLLYYFVMGDNVNIAIDMYAFFIWLFYGVAMVSLFTLRKQRPEAKRPFRVPSLIPVLVMIIAVFMSLATLTSGPLRTILVFFIVCISFSLLIHYIFIYKKLRFTLLGRIQGQLQNVLGLVTPPEEPV